MIVIDPGLAFLLVLAGLVVGVLVGYAAGREVGYEIGWKHALRAVDTGSTLPKEQDPRQP